MIDDCHKHTYAKNMCQTHYRRVRQHGDPHTPAKRVYAIEEGKTWKDPKGYVLVAIKTKDGKYGQVRQHRQVMEQYLGRELASFETVHHKNGIRDDNRIENLELWTTNQKSGQRVEDLLDFVTTHYRDELLAILLQDLEDAGNQACSNVRNCPESTRPERTDP